MCELERISWFCDKIELKNCLMFDCECKFFIYKKLVEVFVFEGFFGKKFVGQKWFFVEGGEFIIFVLEVLVEKGLLFGVEYFVMGMVYWGCLNIFVNIFCKCLFDIFFEFEGKEFDWVGVFDGDVKYYQGYIMVI